MSPQLSEETVGTYGKNYALNVQFLLKINRMPHDWSHKHISDAMQA